MNIDSVIISLYFFKVWYTTPNKQGILCAINVVLIEKNINKPVVILNRITSQDFYTLIVPIQFLLGENTQSKIRSLS